MYPSWSRHLIATATVLVLLAPAAAAGPKAATYFLHEAPLDPANGHLGPAGPGVLNSSFPSFEAAKLRPIPIGANELDLVEFHVSSENETPSYLLGPIFLAVWLGPDVILDANVTAAVYLVNDTDRLEIGNASINLAFDPEELPDPLTLIPEEPEVPSDPEAILGQTLAQVLPYVVKMPRFLNLGFVNMEVPEGSQLVLEFFLEPTDPDALLPLPEGLAATLMYDGMLAPTLLYVPWYEFTQPTYTTQPPRTTTTPSSTDGPSSASSSNTDGADPQEGGGGKSPGASAALMLAAVAAVGVVVARRRHG